TGYPGSEAELARLVRSTPVPVLLGGGELGGSDADFLARASETMRAGCAGICFGRNLFQRRPVAPLARKLAELLHGSGGSAPP
ncbi:MAG TPA: hypothetical protein VLY85_02195, partial [Thermoplasmata archaeon]|nr:hypothetical protein [Thermoplasmata archaeon]